MRHIRTDDCIMPMSIEPRRSTQAPRDTYKTSRGSRISRRTRCENVLHGGCGRLNFDISRRREILSSLLLWDIYIYIYIPRTQLDGTRARVYSELKRFDMQAQWMIRYLKIRNSLGRSSRSRLCWCEDTLSRTWSRENDCSRKEMREKTRDDDIHILLAKNWVILQTHWFVKKSFFQKQSTRFIF